MAVRITHEQADTRRHLWIEAPLRVEIDDRVLEARAWSVAGVAIDEPVAGPSAREWQPGETVALRLELPYQGFDVGFRASGEVESFDPASGRVIIGWRNLGQREHDLIARVIESLVRGSLVPVQDTLDRLSYPGIPALAPVNDTGMPPPTVSARGRRTGRTVAMTALYALAGALLLGYLGILVYSNVYWLEAQSSAISAPVETLVSLGDGVVGWSSFKPGDPVKAGDLVLNVYDNALEREIEDAEITVRERENKLAYLLKRQDSEKRRMGTLADLSGQKTLHMSAEIEGLQAKLKSANRELRQLPGAAVGPIAQVRQRIVGLKQAIALKELELSGRATVSQQSTGTFEVVGQTVVGDLDNLAAQAELAEADIAIAARRHQSFLNQRDRLAIRAPFDGVLRDLPHADNSIVRRGDVAAVIERSVERSITARVRQDQLTRIRLGAAARVFIPATQETLTATVAEIEPARTTRDQGRPNAGQSGQRSDDATATVHLVLASAEGLQTARGFHDGLPVVTMIELGRPSLAWRMPLPLPLPLPDDEVRTAAGPDPTPPHTAQTWAIDALIDKALASLRRQPHSAPSTTNGLGG